MKQMKGFLVLVAVVAMSLGAACSLSPASASSTYWRKCGSQPGGGAGWYHVKAHNLYCGKARAVAKRYTYGLAYNPSPEPLGFSCQRRRVGYESSRVACRRIFGHQVQKVRFTFGA